MRKLATLSLATSLLLSSAALAQDTIVVDLTGISADIATELGLDADEVPGTVSVSADLAAEVCGIAVGDLGATCTATTISADLTAAIEADIDDEDMTGSENSAREFAPGQQDGPAKDSAPGQQEGHAKDSAPGQLKKQ